MGQAYNPLPLNFTPIGTSEFVVPLGVSEWLDTDVSATTGTDTTKLWIIICKPGGGDFITGVRKHGSSVNCQYAAISEYTAFAYVGPTGHMDLFRSTGNNKYEFIGYLQ